MTTRPTTLTVMMARALRMALTSPENPTGHELIDAACDPIRATLDEMIRRRVRTSLAWAVAGIVALVATGIAKVGDQGGGVGALDAVQALGVGCLLVTALEMAGAAELHTVKRLFGRSE